VAYTYNDPVIFAEYAIDTALACRERGLLNIAVTAGYLCAEPRADFFAVMDAANIDLKSFDPQFYRRVVGGHLEDVLDTLRYVAHQTSCWLEVTTLLIPGLNDSETELATLTAWVAEELGPAVPLHFSAFHPDNRMLEVPPTPPARLTRARQLGLAAGLQFVYTGNVRDRVGSTTYCPGCGRGVIERDWYQVVRSDLDPAGHCRHCATRLPGRWDPRPS
jgi:pyruvate formate lyase activating enzyme